MLVFINTQVPWLNLLQIPHVCCHYHCVKCSDAVAAVLLKLLHCNVS